MNDPMAIIGVISGTALVAAVTWTAASWNERARRQRLMRTVENLGRTVDKVQQDERREYQKRLAADEALKAEAAANMRLVRRMNEIREQQERAAA